MKPSILFVGLAMFAGSALGHAAIAADPAGPVREIIGEAQNGWSETPVGEPRDYFDDERLGRIYSRDFVRVYRDAARFPAFDEGDSPFDYDVIVGGQDSCSLKDVKIAPPAAPVEGRSDVTVTFDNTSCLDDGAVRAPAELHFLMIEEDGHPAIDDIVRAGSAGSVKAELAAIAAQGAQ